MISALKLVTNSKHKKLGVEVKGSPESSKERLAEALATFISVDNTRSLVTMGELAQFSEVHKVVLPSFDKEVYKHPRTTEGEEVLTFRPEEQRTKKKLLVNTSKIHKDKCGPPFMEEVLCQAMFQSIKEEEWNRDARGS